MPSVWTEDNGDGTLTTHIEDEEDEIEVKSYDGTVIARHGSGIGRSSITVPAPGAPPAKSYRIKRGPIPKKLEPPNGWYPFGMHAAWDSSPQMEFSDETDEAGMPLWEKPTSHTYEGMKRFVGNHFPTGKRASAAKSCVCVCGDEYKQTEFDLHFADMWEKYLSGERL